MSMVPSRIVGVDTHARSHTFAVLTADTGKLLETQAFPTTPAGLARSAAWIRRGRGEAVVAVEGSGSYGANLTRLLQANDVQVAEMDAPSRRDNKRGKSDPLDAEDIARRALAKVDRLGVPRAQTGHLHALSILLTARASMNNTRTASCNQLLALLRGHELGIDARGKLTTTQIIQISGWRARNEEISHAVARAEAVRLARTIRSLDVDLRANNTQLLVHVVAVTPTLTEAAGIGPVTAGQILASHGPAGRIRSEAAFARLAGTAPIEASSGNTKRHRIHRGGDRQLNAALWRIAKWRYDHDPDTKPYIERRQAEGKTRPDIIRCLQRHIARKIWRQLAKTLDPTP